MINLGKSALLIGISFLLISNLACEKDDVLIISEEFQLTKFDAKKVQKNNSTLTFAHFMPWFVSPETNNGKWGIHWTMANKNPAITSADGKRQIASHYYPLTGPYASSDKDIVEYQLLLMKYAGIDGVLIDWYGSTDVNDYGSNRLNSEVLINALKGVGLDYAIVYEDRTIPEVVKNNGSIDRIEAAQNDMLYMEDEYFSDPNYIKINDAPLLLVFGPEEFKNSSDWGEVLGILNEEPTFVTLNWSSSKTEPYSVGEYIWVDQGSLDSKYKNKDKFDVFIGGAYPGFNDYYSEGGWGEGYFVIDHNNGETFKANLQKAKHEAVDYLQLITWNDYGEGTMIEPTEEFEFEMLECVQEFAEVEYTVSDLEKIFDLYTLRKANSNLKFQEQLDQAFYYLVSLQNEKAFAIIDSLNVK